MDIEVKNMSPEAVELLEQLSVVCRRYGISYYSAPQTQRDLLDSIALHEYRLKKPTSRANRALWSLRSSG